MNHKGKRMTLLVIELFVGLWAVIGGVGLVTGSIAFLHMPATYLQGTPFSDYTLPGLVLLLVVGGSFLFAAATILTKRAIGVLASLLAGLILIGFEGVEVALIDRDTATLPTALPQQILMAALGLCCVGLAAFIWRRAYRGQSLLDHHASPA